MKKTHLKSIAIAILITGGLLPVSSAQPLLPPCVKTNTIKINTGINSAEAKVTTVGRRRSFLDHKRHIWLYTLRGHSRFTGNHYKQYGVGIRSNVQSDFLFERRRYYRLYNARPG